MTQIRDNDVRHIKLFNFAKLQLLLLLIFIKLYYLMSVELKYNW